MLSNLLLAEEFLQMTIHVAYKLVQCIFHRISLELNRCLIIINIWRDV